MSPGRAALPALALLGAVGCTAPNPAFMMETPCEGGSRQCLTSPTTRRSRPVVCGRDDAGAPALLEERCPASASCQAGLCAPPQGAKGCARQGDCAKTEVCVPLVGEGKALGAFCLPAAAAIAAPGQECKQDEDCQSYLCLPFRTGSTGTLVNRCLKLCGAALDCQIPDECRSLNVTVTGVPGSIKSCLPSG